MLLHEMNKSSHSLAQKSFTENCFNQGCMYGWIVLIERRNPHHVNSFVPTVLPRLSYKAMANTQHLIQVLIKKAKMKLFENVLKVNQEIRIEKLSRQLI